MSTALEVSEGRADATVVVRNRGAGEGQIALKVTLRDASGKVVAREARTVELGERETIEVTVELTAPKDAGALKVEAEAVYPPD
ncbi:MAG TPA: hypothetical protein VFM93_03470 [Candidatus Limnocylindria bacterium]|nr:hypothetical protein [Candidatus Limnocylindria bacterium]